MARRYELGDEIARGGMGRVVEATDTTLGRVVALKEALATDADALRRFAREIQITARLEHPAIVPVHDAGVLESGQPYYVMRKISGKPLEALVGAAAHLDARLPLVPVIVAAAHALAHAHERGVIHRDIKPPNILVGDLGETMVIDWGLAKVIDEPDDPHDPAALAIAATAPHDSIHTRAGIVFGTPGFMAPEVVRGEPADARSDVYALGATLYHLLARRPPHYAATAEEMMRAAAEHPPKRVGELVDGVPAELEAIVDKSIALEPRDRYQSARELADDLSRFLGGQLVAAHRYSRGERFVRFAKRNAAALVVAMVAVAALGALGVGSFIRVRDERDRADLERADAVAQRAEADRRRAEATDRADQLALGEARALAATNPTAAIAKVKPLAAKWWREARAIGAAARSSGVAYGLPGPVHAIALDVRGTHALAVGDDSSVRVFDLAARTTRDLGVMAGVVSARFAGETKLAIASRMRIAVVDLETGARRTIDAPAPLADNTLATATSGTTLAWLDRDGGAWRLELAAGEPARVDAGEPARSISLSPDGTAVAIGGAEHLIVVADGVATPVAAGATAAMVWDDAGRNLSAIVGDTAIEVEMAAPPSIVHKAVVGARTGIALVAGRTYVLGPTGIAVASRDRDGGTMRRPLAGYTLGLGGARGNVVAAAAPQGEIVLVSDDGERVITTPGLALARFASSPSSPYVIAAATGRVLAWSVDDVLPRRLVDTRPASAGFAGAHAVVAYERATHWLDPGAAPPGDVIVDDTPAFVALAAAPDGSRAAIVDLAHRGRVVEPGKDAVSLGDYAIDRLGFVDRARVVAAGADGSVHLFDLDAKRDSVLVTRAGPVAALAWSATEVAASFADKVVWRHPLASAPGAGDDTLTLAAPAAAMAFAADGTLLIAIRDEIHAWRGGPHDSIRARLPRPATELAVAGDRAIAIAGDGAAYDMAVAGGAIHAAIATGAPARSVSRATALYVATPQPTQLAVFDPIAGASWPIAASSANAFELPRISDDGTRVLAIVPTGLVAWRLELPGDAAATAAWLDHLTNAIAPGEPTTLEWK